MRLHKAHLLSGDAAALTAALTTESVVRLCPPSRRLLWTRN